MGEEAMVRMTAKEDMVSRATLLLDALDQKHWNISRALWYYSPDSENWRLVISLPHVREKGRLPYYKQLNDVFRRTKMAFDPFTVTILDTKDSFFDSLTGASDVIALRPENKRAPSTKRKHK